MFGGVSRSPDGSLVASEKIGLGDGERLMRARLVGGALRWRSLDSQVGPVLGFSYERSIVATGETVYAWYDEGWRPRLVRLKVAGEVAGPTVVLRGREADQVGELVRVDATHAGSVGIPHVGGRPRLALIDTRGIRQLPRVRVRGATNFSPDVRTASGALVDLRTSLRWRYPAPLSPVTYRTASDDIDPSADPHPATGTGEDVVTVRTPGGELKRPSSTPSGDPVTSGEADAQVAIYSRTRPARLLDVPVPQQFDAQCRALSSVVDAHATTVRGLWRGPAASIWALAGCGLGPSEYGPNFIWLVHWDRATLTPTIVPLPPRPHGRASPRWADGKLMADGAMYVATDRGTIRVTGVRGARPRAGRIQRVSERPGGRVRVVISCAGGVGDLCAGRVRVRDESGTVATLPYAVDSGTRGMQPSVTREVAVGRETRGTPRAALIR